MVTKNCLKFNAVTYKNDLKIFIRFKDRANKVWTYRATSEYSTLKWYNNLNLNLKKKNDIHPSSFLQKILFQIGSELVYCSTKHFAVQ